MANCVCVDADIKKQIISRLKEYALISERRRMLLDELNGMNLYNPNTSRIKATPGGKNKKTDISDLLVRREKKREAYTLINIIYSACCIYIYDLPINDSAIKSLIRYINGEIQGRASLLNRVATEIAAACNDIDVYLPGMIKKHDKIKHPTNIVRCKR